MDTLPDFVIALTQIFHVLGVEVMDAVATTGDLIDIAADGAQKLDQLHHAAYIQLNDITVHSHLSQVRSQISCP